MKRYIRVFLLGIFMMFGFTNSANASSRMYTLPITSTAPYNITYYPDPTQRDMGNTPCADDPYYPYYGGSKPHEGMDFILPVGTPIHAAASGTVTHVFETCEDNICYGNYLYINHGNNNWTMYAHLNSYVASDGQSVNQGDLIAYSGTSGTSTPHLHWEVVTGSSAVGGNPHNPYYCDDEWFTTSPSIYADQYNAITAKADELWALDLIEYEPTGGDMHWYGGDDATDTTYIIEDWTGGSWGWVAIT